VRAVSEAVAYVHEQGVVHGDLKPANVLIGRGGAVFFTDFGLAQFTSPKPGQRPWLVGGTEGYLAPEIRIHGCLPGPKADVFGLGALLWSLVAGSVPRLPFLAPDDVEIPKALLDVCAKCLNDDPNRRFQSVVELARELELVERTIRD
jgi:serine/threonine protein kinase